MSERKITCCAARQHSHVSTAAASPVTRNRELMEQHSRNLDLDTMRRTLSLLATGRGPAHNADRDCSVDMNCTGFAAKDKHAIPENVWKPTSACIGTKRGATPPSDWERGQDLDHHITSCYMPHPQRIGLVLCAGAMQSPLHTPRISSRLTTKPLNTVILTRVTSCHAHSRGDCCCARATVAPYIAVYTLLHLTTQTHHQIAIAVDPEQEHSDHH